MSKVITYNNTSIGFRACNSPIQGNNNTLLGAFSVLSDPYASNNIVLGNNAIEYLRCQVTSITSLSDARDKTNIESKVNDTLSWLDKNNLATKEEFDSVMMDLDSFISRHKDNSELKQLLDKLLDLSRLVSLKLKKKHKFKSETKEYVITQEQFEKILASDLISEKWTNKYKRSIDCKNPKGFSQKAHCQARKKRKSGEPTKSKSPFKK